MSASTLEDLNPLDDTETLPTEIRPLVDALNDLIARLADSRDALRRRFVANAAHQLRTPLAAMQIQTQRAMRETDPLRHQEALTAVEKAVMQLTHLTNQLLVCPGGAEHHRGDRAQGDRPGGVSARSSSSGRMPPSRAARISVTPGRKSVPVFSASRSCSTISSTT